MIRLAWMTSQQVARGAHQAGADRDAALDDRDVWSEPAGPLDRLAAKREAFLR